MRLRAHLARTNRLAALVAGGGLFAMMVIGAADVVMSNLDLLGLTARPIPATTEFTGTMMVVAIFFALALGQQQRRHIRITLSRYASGRTARILDAFRHIVHGTLYALIAWFGWQVAGHSFSTGEFAAGLYDFPVWPARLALALGASLMVVQCIADFGAAVFGWRDVPGPHEVSQDQPRP